MAGSRIEFVQTTKKTLEKSVEEIRTRLASPSSRSRFSPVVIQQIEHILQAADGHIQSLKEEEKTTQDRAAASATQQESPFSPKKLLDAVVTLAQDSMKTSEETYANAIGVLKLILAILNTVNFIEKFSADNHLKTLHTKLDMLNHIFLFIQIFQKKKIPVLDDEIPDLRVPKDTIKDWSDSFSSILNFSTVIFNQPYLLKLKDDCLTMRSEIETMKSQSNNVFQQARNFIDSKTAEVSVYLHRNKVVDYHETVSKLYEDFIQSKLFLDYRTNGDENWVTQSASMLFVEVTNINAVETQEDDLTKALRLYKSVNSLMKIQEDIQSKKQEIENRKKEKEERALWNQQKTALIASVEKLIKELEESNQSFIPFYRELPEDFFDSDKKILKDQYFQMFSEAKPLRELFETLFSNADSSLNEARNLKTALSALEEGSSRLGELSEELDDIKLFLADKNKLKSIADHQKKILDDLSKYNDLAMLRLRVNAVEQGYGSFLMGLGASFYTSGEVTETFKSLPSSGSFLMQQSQVQTVQDSLKVNAPEDFKKINLPEMEKRVADVEKKYDAIKSSIKKDIAAHQKKKQEEERIRQEELAAEAKRKEEEALLNKKLLEEKKKKEDDELALKNLLADKLKALKNEKEIALRWINQKSNDLKENIVPKESDFDGKIGLIEFNNHRIKKMREELSRPQFDGKDQILARLVETTIDPQPKLIIEQSMNTASCVDLKLAADTLFSLPSSTLTLEDQLSDCAAKLNADNLSVQSENREKHIAAKTQLIQAQVKGYESMLDQWVAAQQATINEVQDYFDSKRQAVMEQKTTMEQAKQDELADKLNRASLLTTLMGNKNNEQNNQRNFSNRVNLLTQRYAITPALNYCYFDAGIQQIQQRLGKIQAEQTRHYHKSIKWWHFRTRFQNHRANKNPKYKDRPSRTKRNYLASRLAMNAFALKAETLFSEFRDIVSSPDSVSVKRLQLKRVCDDMQSLLSGVSKISNKMEKKWITEILNVLFSSLLPASTVIDRDCPIGTSLENTIKNVIQLYESIEASQRQEQEIDDAIKTEGEAIRERLNKKYDAHIATVQSQWNVWDELYRKANAASKDTSYQPERRAPVDKKPVSDKILTPVKQAAEGLVEAASSAGKAASEVFQEAVASVRGMFGVGDASSSSSSAPASPYQAPGKKQ